MRTIALPVMFVVVGLLGRAAIDKFLVSLSGIAAVASWAMVGQMQAVWRTSDWVTAIVAGVLHAHFLPRLGLAAGDRSSFLRELRRSAAWSLLPAGAALALVWALLPALLALIYRDDIGVSRLDAGCFLLGDWVRVASWVALFGLFARRSAWAISVGEFLSLPLFALLLSLFHPLTLGEVGLVWLASYAAYAAFSGFVLAYGLRRRSEGTP